MWVNCILEQALKCKTSQMEQDFLFKTLIFYYLKSSLQWLLDLTT